MGYSPNDRAFMRAVSDQITGDRSDERVIFIDHDDKIREVIYAPEFANGLLQRERARLEESGVLKGVVHVSATLLGMRDGPGPRYSTVEYLPNKETYVLRHIVDPMTWVRQRDIIDAALEATEALFNGEEDTEDDDK